ncbi:MAG: Flp pilus assembly complex ATPase component TadA [Candidatus Obscuribacterales bacterium]|nr:Flp pilus assembly complex ATPase component TadA [Candidatus Obscuribacterales bacterium]
MALIKKEIGELLVENGLITDEELKLVQAERARTGDPLTVILSRMGLAGESHLKNALELQYGVPYVALAKVEADEELMTLLPDGIMRQHQLVPVSRQGNRLTIAMVNPNNLLALDDIKYRLKGFQVSPLVCTEDDFQSFMETMYARREAELFVSPEEQERQFIEGDVDLSTLDTIDTDLDMSINEIDLARSAEDAPIIYLANQIIAKAIKQKCSDIHAEPQEEDMIIRYRLDGVLYVDRKLPKAIISALVSRFKVMSSLDIAERRVPQDGRIRVRFANKDIDFRVSTVPGRYGEKVVMRILDSSNVQLSLDKLITDSDSLGHIREMIRKPFGIIFVTGPTGSGKSTSLYSALAELNSPGVNIVTAEDPIEYEMIGINQTQVLREKGLDFSRILRAFLRQDPDVMLVGETRDKETAKVAVEAALTGHLVFTTLHTNDAPSAITRLAEMDIDPFLVASATIGIIAQRLVRKVCAECKTDYVPDRALLEYIGMLDKGQEALADATIKYYRLNVGNNNLPIFYKGVGCDVCNKTGYKGRVGVYEVLRINDEIRELISSGASTAMLRFAAKQSGMIPLKDYSLRLVGEGMTTIDEIIRVTMSDTGGEDKLCPKCRNPIGVDFMKCPFCRVDLKQTCKRCGTFQEAHWSSCPKCGLTTLEAALDGRCECCQANVPGSWHCCPHCQTKRKIVQPVKQVEKPPAKPLEQQSGNEAIAL